MKEPLTVLEKINQYTPLIDDEIKKTIGSQEKYQMYGMMEYFLGYKDKNLNLLKKSYGGKRFRPGITLLLSDFYGTLEKAVGVAASIEVFHNFTLIHDDIEDNDPLRRGRPTVWKVWGTPQAINSGDAQLILSNIQLTKAVLEHDLSLDVITFLNDVYLKITEGQFLDISMSELGINDEILTEEYYLKMIGKKSAHLIGASAKVAGMIASKDKDEIEGLWSYGYNLGLAYQLYDDYLSIWGEKDSTGKEEMIDIRDKKKSLPIIALYKSSNQTTKDRLAKIYSKKGYLTDDEVAEVKGLLDASSVREDIKSKLEEFNNRINEGISKVGISKEEKEQLSSLSKALLSLPEDA